MDVEPRVRLLLEELLDSERTPEEVCRDCPELLPQVREHWRRKLACDAQLDALFPAPELQLRIRRPIVEAVLDRTCPGSQVMKSRRCSATAAWASSTGPGTCASTAPSPSRCCSPVCMPSPRVSRALLAGSGSGGRSAASEYRPGPRHGRAGRPALLHHGVRRGRQPGPEIGGHAPAAPPGRRAAGDPGRSRPGGPPERDRASRPEAGERPAHRRRHAQDQRLRAGPPAGWRGRPHLDRYRGRDAELHGPRAGRSQAAHGGVRPSIFMPWEPSCTSC